MGNEGVFMASTKEKELEIIKKDNRLVEANYKITTNQWRVIISLLGKIRTDDQDFEDYTVNLAELAELFGATKSRSFYAEVQQATKELMDTTIDISIGKRRRFTHFLSFVEYIEGEASMLVRFDKALKPYLLNLKSSFTTYELAAVVNFKTSYSIRFYEFLKMRQNMGKGGQFYIEYTILELKEKLGITLDQYQYTKDFRMRVIEPALKEIKDYSDLQIIQTDYIKKGRAIHSVKIYAEPKKQRMIAIQDPEAPSTTPTSKDTLEPRPKAVQALIDFGFSESEARALVRTNKGEKVTQALAYVAHKRTERELKDPCAYLRTVIKGDAGEKWAKAQQEAKEQSQKQIFDLQKQEAEELKRIEKERKELARLIEVFKQLDELDQEVILDEIELGLKGIVLARFKSERGAFEAGGNDTGIFRLHAETFKAVLTSHGYIS